MIKSSSGCDRQTKIAIAGGISGLLLAVSAPNVLAQQVQAATDLDAPSIEVVEVVGVRSQLESALADKRNASSIIDVINANDIDALPALDFGEALQVIPGVQLNNDQEGRQSTISLRGLSGGFVKTTAMGQSFATPAAASNLNAVGSPNPFSAFEAGIFDGVAVIKSPTADLQEGGVAGTVDKKLQEALSKKDGLAKISAGARYEELTGNYDPNIAASFVKHLIEDKLAVAFKIAGSGQTFRRDTFDIIDYRTAGDGRASNLAEYRAAYNIPDTFINADGEVEDTVVDIPLQGRNVSEYSEGHRISFSGNIEFQATDSLKLGAHILSSQRNLDDGTKEATTFSPGFNRNRSDRDNFDASVELDLDVAPIQYQDGFYTATAYDYVNGTLRNENRKTTFVEKSDGIIAYADFVTDDWEFGAKLTHSEASNEFENVGISYTVNQDWRAALPGFTDENGRRTNLAVAPTGFNGRIDTGRGNLNDVVVTGALETPLEYNNLAWTVPNITSSVVTSIDEANGLRRLQLAINGRVRDLSRELSSAEFDGLRNLDFGSDAFTLNSVKIGGRFSRETLDSIDQRQGPGGIDTSQLSDEYFTDRPLSVTQNEYFGGNIPGTFGAPTAETGFAGWSTFDNDAAIAALQTGIVTERENLVTGRSFDAYEELERNRTGFWDTVNRNSGLPNNLAFNFDAEQDITALYLTTDFSGDLGPISYSGNAGVRHVETDNTFNGFQTFDGNRAELREFTDSYSHTLPMANLSVNLMDDLVLRTAYYEGIVRPNLLAQPPTAALSGGATRVDLTLPSATVKPYEADNIDVSLEWYNRKGSAITIGYFEKEISNLFDRLDGFCPAPGVNAIVDNQVGELESFTNEDNTIGCRQVEQFEDDEGNLLQRDVVIRAPVNTDKNIKVDGFEVAIQQNLDFLPYPFNGLGGVLNYTEINQTTDDPNVQLSRISPKSYNAVAYWENDGISVRLQYNWRDKQEIQGANGFLGTGVRNRAETERLDLVTSYKLNKQTKIFFRAYNLTDNIGKEYWGYNEQALSRATYTGRIFQTSVNYTF